MVRAPEKRKLAVDRRVLSILALPSILIALNVIGRQIRRPEMAEKRAKMRFNPARCVVGCSSLALLVVGDQNIEQARDLNALGIAILTNALRDLRFLSLQQGKSGVVISRVRGDFDIFSPHAIANPPDSGFFDFT